MLPNSFQTIASFDLIAECYKFCLSDSIIYPVLITIFLLDQEMVRLMREKRYPTAFKCYHNYHKVDYISSDNLFYKMVIHVHSDSVFRRYQKEMRSCLNLHLTIIRL